MSHYQTLTLANIPDIGLTIKTCAQSATYVDIVKGRLLLVEGEVENNQIGNLYRLIGEFRQVIL